MSPNEQSKLVVEPWTECRFRRLAHFGICGNLKVEFFIGEIYAHDFHVLWDFSIDVLQG